MKKSTVAEFYRVFGKMLGSGIPILSSIDALGKDGRFSEMKDFFDYLHNSVRFGCGVGETMLKAGFPVEQSEATGWAEHYGNLDERFEDIARLAESGTDFEIRIPDEDFSEEKKAFTMVNELINHGFSSGASDLHIIPGISDVMLKYRINGVLTDHGRMEKKLLQFVSSRLKTMAQCDVAECRLPQDGRIMVKVNGEDLDIRLGTVPTNIGEKITLRFIRQNRVIIDMEKLGFNGEQMDRINRMLFSTHGLILVNGGSGSGKTTTAYSMMKKLVERNLNVVSVEERVEYVIEGSTQITLRPYIGLTAEAAIRTVFRMDPDAVFISEFRDAECINLALKLAQTGHLVICTTCCRTDEDLFEMISSFSSVNHEIFANVLLGTVTQSLPRRLCECRKKEKASDKISGRYGISETFIAEGCEKCLNSGYLGRTGIFSIYTADRSFKEAVAVNDLNKIKDLLPDGVTETALEKIRSGETSAVEIGRLGISL